MRLESHIENTGVEFIKPCTPTKTISFCDVILSRFLLIDIRTFHHVSQLQTNHMSGHAGFAMFHLELVKGASAQRVWDLNPTLKYEILTWDL